MCPRCAQMDLETYYVQRSYDQLAKEFHQSRMSGLWSLTKRFYQLIGDQPCHILDAGCGNGHNMISPHTYTGLDISREVLKYVRFPNSHTVVGSITDIPSFDQTFDHSMAIGVIHHLSSVKLRQQAVSELIRVTEPGGWICISVWRMNPTDPNRDKHDIILEWHHSHVYRYFHLFHDDELIDLVKSIDTNIEIAEYGIDGQSYYIVFRTHSN